MRIWLLALCTVFACAKNPNPSPPTRSAASHDALSHDASMHDGSGSSLLHLPTEVVWETPAFVSVRPKLAANDFLGAAAELERLMTATPGIVDPCKGHYATGVWFLRGKEYARALPHLSSLRGSSGCFFVPWGRVAEAKAFLALNDPKRALEALGVNAEHPGGDAGAGARGDAGESGLVASNTSAPFPSARLQKEHGILLAYAALKSEDRPLFLQVARTLTSFAEAKEGLDVQLELARADLVGCAAECRPHEALPLLTKLATSYPKWSDSRGVLELRTQALAQVAKGPAPVWSDDETHRIAVAWSQQDKEKAAEWIDTNLASPTSANDLQCKLSILRASSAPKKKGPTSPLWENAVARCKGSDLRPSALYNLAKAKSGEKKKDEAAKVYERLEKEFPGHRLADDARFHRAAMAGDVGDTAKALSLYDSVATDYESGDMVEEALFRAALMRIEEHDWKSADTRLEKILSLRALDPKAMGRAAYFHHRAMEERGESRRVLAAGYAEILQSYPGTVYALLAMQRLSVVDPAAARERRGKLTDPGASREALASAAPCTKCGDPTLVPVLAHLELGLEHEVTEELKDFSKSIGREDIVSYAALLYRLRAYDRSFAAARPKLAPLTTLPTNLETRTEWELLYPRAFRELVERESAQQKIPQSLTWAIMREESTFVPGATSVADAFGLMQIIVPTAKGVAKPLGLPFDEESLKRPDLAISYGTRILASLRARTPYNPALAIPGYNAGPGAVDRWLRERGNMPFDLFIERIPYDETRNYIKKVLSSQFAYALLYAPNELDELLNLPYLTRPISAVPDAGAP